MSISIKNIVNGWENYLNPEDATTEEKAKERAEFCAKCEHAKKGLILTMLPDGLKNIKGRYCGLCGGCPLSAKVRSKDEKCDLGLW